MVVMNRQQVRFFGVNVERCHRANVGPSSYKFFSRSAGSFIIVLAATT